ncbi:MAG: Glucosaminyl phosphatidylinositol (GlcN-PI) nositol acylation protein [Alyxoria varia]|nr:MAG: Glucosaminyl phosphatidylinositol (GlcN-PI) nositol acylation protein [Alyxoria varia]
MASKSNEQKLAKEAFVSNLTGSQIGEINLVTTVAPASALLWSALQIKQSLFTPYTPISGLIDFLLFCGSFLFATTLYSDHLILLNLLLILPAIITLLVPDGRPPREIKQRRQRSAKSEEADVKSQDEDPLPVKPFLTTYRGWMLVSTFVAILAVDFRVFPRRFAKVEAWGTSVMDLGVGSFVFSAGTMAARPILKQNLSKTAQKGLTARLVAAGRHSLPLLVLGFARLVSVKASDYNEHESEYGRHWNFFFTLGFIPPFVAVFDAVLYRILPSYGILALLLGAGYQVLLDSTDLIKYILIAPRTDVISMNREGIFSFIGYLSIFLAGQATGMYVLPRSKSSTGQPQQGVKALINDSLIRKLTMWATIWTALFYLTTDYRFGAGVQVSRRIANLPYILWVTAFNTWQILLYGAIETLLFPGLYSNAKSEEVVSSKAARILGMSLEQLKEMRSINLQSGACSRLMKALNRNGLALFLVANLLTGAVNLSVDTLAMGDAQAVGILLAYMGVLSGLALLLDWLDVSIKL